MSDVTRILNQIESGEPQAAEKLLPLVYDELRVLATQKLSQEQSGQTLQATALVHEAYLRLLGNQPDKPWSHRGHFFGAAAEAMRRILIDQARRKRTTKSGGDLNRIEFGDVDAVQEPKSIDLLALDEALTKLEETHPRQVEVIKLRYFAGLTIQQAADALDISPSTADADWAYARGWLKIEMSKS